ncbi:succinate--CoA ligase subunit beta [Magnetospirillum sp. UT-4]|uniref:succinate--CoA ligase subunit beta n=1 Tax=Magnetospirillum sp. UT-4 TaxID=2681467 RepID=UPI001385088F|nr:ATP-grasp domain-containing protein [Magnetospirillum sp. UT-4]CAA7614351.1 Succinyl-CoA ligase (ADP-forming) subunit beta [Magnetospirillum sp. UT-4]
MNFEEYAGKRILAQDGLAVPRGRLAQSAEEAEAIAVEIGPVVIKAQVPAGKRGKSGGVKVADTPEEAASCAEDILGMMIGGYVVERLLVEEKADIAREFYAAVLDDPASRGPLVMFSTEGGMDIEEVADSHPEAIRRASPGIREGFDITAAAGMLAGLDVPAATAGFLADLYRVWRTRDAELVEINPLAELRDGRLVALDCKFVLDESSAFRQPDIAGWGAAERMTRLEQRGRDLGLKYIELDGSVGVLANGAGLTMTTMDVIAHFGGKPANFLEIGGEAYTKATPALELVLANPGVKSLIINFCGAFARTDVMAEGVVKAWLELRPNLPAFFSIHGTNEDEAVRLVRERLGFEPYDRMEDAVRAAVEAAR